MPTLFQKSTAMMLRRTGDLWSAELDGEFTEFYGVFDAENRLEDDNTGMPVLIAGSVVTVLTSVAKKFSFDHELTDQNGSIWLCREVVRIDDGFLSRCHLTLKTEVTDDC